MSEVKIVGCGVDTLVLNVCYADKQFQPIKQELVQELQEELNALQQEARENEAPLITCWAFSGEIVIKADGKKGPPRRGDQVRLPLARRNNLLLPRK